MPSAKNGEPAYYFFALHEFLRAQKIYNDAASKLHQTAATAINLADSGADPKRCIEALRKPVADFELAAYGDKIETKPKA